MTATFRRRADNFVLRWQARLDSEWADRVLPWVLAGGLFVLLELLSFARVRSLDGTVDFATYTQATWLVQEGNAPAVTVQFGSNLLSQQAAFVLYPITGLSFLVGVQAALLLVQAGALALAVVPIWRIARRLANLRVGAALALVAVYALYPTMHNLAVAGFYPETLALPGLLYAAYFGLAKHWRRFAACCIFVVACRSDLGLAVAGLGGLLIVEGRKVEGRAALVGGIAYTALAVFVVQPRFGDGGFAHIAAFSAYGDTAGSVVWGLLTHPGQLLGDLFREQNFNLFVTLFAPVAFLPLLAPRYLLPVLPLQGLFLVSNVPREAVFGRQTVAITAFVFLAAAFALARIGRLGVEKIMVDRRVLAVLLFSAMVFFVRDAASSPYRQPWNWGGRDQVDHARIRAADRIGADSAVRASSSMLTVVAERARVYELTPTPRPEPTIAAEGVDAVVLDTRAVTAWTAAERRAFADGLADLGFAKVSEEEGIEVYIRKR